MLVSNQILSNVIDKLNSKRVLAVDTETTGLYPYSGDRLFSIIVSDNEEDYYFNFTNYPNLSDNFVLDRNCIKDILTSPALLFLHNAKFDMHFLYKEGLDLSDPRFKIHCTQSTARIIDNDKLRYSLDALAQEIGYSKDDAPKLYAVKNKLYDWVTIPGKKKREKAFRYQEVPLEIMQPYGEKDGRITYQLGQGQLDQLQSLSERFPDSYRTPLNVYENECKLTKVLFEMEKAGVKVDREYTYRAYLYEKQVYEDCERDFYNITGEKFVDSGKALSSIYDRKGYRYGSTEKGRPSFNDETLQENEDELSKLILKHREAYKRANTYYNNFLYLMDDSNVIHTDFRQAGTNSGRMSCSNPNLQNVPKKVESEFHPRRCFVPREDYYLVMIDYDQMEYRLMMDYANEEGIIKKILEEGLDVHDATGAEMGTNRDQAKTINFGLLYGQGAEKLGAALKCSVDEAKNKKRAYFSKFTKVQKFINGVIDAAKKRGFIFNWYGRICNFRDSNFAYKAPNHLIQGGCADIVKLAMVKTSEYLQRYKSKLILQIHDELIFEIHKSEVSTIIDLVNIMQTVYPHKHLPLTAGAEWSDQSWADKKDLKVLDEV